MVNYPNLTEMNEDSIGNMYKSDMKDIRNNLNFVKYELNVNSYGVVDSDQDLSIVFEKFLTSIQDFNDSSSKAKNIKYNHNHIEKHLKYVEKERLKLTDLQSHIVNDLLKPLISKNLAQKNEKID